MESCSVWRDLKDPDSKFCRRNVKLNAAVLAWPGFFLMNREMATRSCRSEGFLRVIAFCQSCCQCFIFLCYACTPVKTPKDDIKTIISLIPIFTTNPAGKSKTSDLVKPFEFDMHVDFMLILLHRYQARLPADSKRCVQIFRLL